MRAGVLILTSLAVSLPAVAALTAPAPRAVPAPAKADAKSAEFFEKKIRPLLVQQCAACHSEKNVKGGLKVDTAAAFFKGGEAGPSVVPGHPEKSLLIDAVSYTKDLKMPPQGKLKPQQIEDLTAWVRMGAPWPGYDGQVRSAPPRIGGPGGQQLFTEEEKRFWAFQPVKNPALPAVKNRAWVASPIDAFILARLEAKGLRPAPKADKRTLIRRVTFDLTGLPPTPQEIDAFLADKSPNAFAKVVDRILASPAYGERWGRHWLDVARYADSNGLDENTAFGNAWRYRDYVIRAFNEDKPYNEFVREQLAGDLLPASQDEKLNADRLTATGFLVLGPKVLAEPDKEKMVMDIVDEQIDTMGRAFMALGLGCARCHDHKFDPLPTKDYYALAGIFKSTRTMETLNTVAKALERPLADSALLAKKQEHEKQLAAKQEELKEATYQADRAVAQTVLSQLDRYLVLAMRAEVPAALAGDVDVDRPGTLLVEAEKFVRGDVQVTQNGGVGYIESAGRSSAFTEYELTVPARAEYTLALRYASGETRPVNLRLNGQVIARGASREPTGGFGPGEQIWKAETRLTLDAGKHLLRLDQAAGSLPHVDKIAFVPVPVDAAAPANPRVLPAAELAKAHRLDPDLLQRVAALAQRGSARIFEPWRAFAALSESDFAAGAQKLVAEWSAAGKPKSWAAPVAAAFSGEAPKSLDEAAARYQKLFSEVSDAWLRQVRTSNKPPQRLGDADREAVRQVLYGSRGIVEKPERLYTPEVRERLAKLKTETETLAKSTPVIPMVLAVDEAPQIGNVKVHIRGNHLTLGEEAPRQFLQIVAGEKQTPITGPRSGRLELADWLTRPDHPLTARVMVNRIWGHHFGEGIVRSPDNFGKLGDRPTHPELLDWLARQFIAKGWSVKAMHRLMLLSNTYQMSTAHDARAALADPENRLLWRFNRRRLEVEAIRDSMLAVSGKLDRTMGGSLLKTANFAYVTNDQSANAAQYDSPRRSIYLPVIRNAVYDVFQVFDFVEPSFLNGKRASTTVAPQALFLMNGEFVLSQSHAFAEQFLAAPGDDAVRVKSAYLQALGRPATAVEVVEAGQYLKTYEEKLGAREPDAAKRRLRAWQSFCQILFASNEFVFVN